MVAEADFARRFFQHSFWLLPAAMLGVAFGFLLGWLCATLTRVATNGRCRRVRLAGLVLPWRAAAACSPLLAVNLLLLIRRSLFLNIPATGAWAGLLAVGLLGLAGAWGGAWGALMERDCPRPPPVALVSRLRSVLVVCVVGGGLLAGMVGGGGLGSTYIRGLQVLRTDLLLRSVGLIFLLAAVVDIAGGLVAGLFRKADPPSAPPQA